MKHSQELMIFQSPRSLKDYIRLIRNNLLAVIIITVLSLIGAVIYAANLIDIYSSKTIIKINKTGGDILQSPVIPEFEVYGSDRFIANEIEIIKSSQLRKRVAAALIDSFNQCRASNKINNCGKLFYTIVDKDSSTNILQIKIKSLNDIANLLSYSTNIEQKVGLDIIVIETESPSSYESALIGNVYAKEYRNLNLELNRNQLTYIKNFLKKQKDEKQNELRKSEDTLKNFQEKGGVIALGEQATALIGELSDFEAKKNAASIELMASEEVLNQYKNELIKQDPGLADYLESVASEAYITAMQQQLAELQINKDLAMAVSNKKDVSARIEEYDRKISELKNRLKEQINVIKTGIFASSPTQVKELSQKIIEEEVRNHSLRITIDGLASIVSNYEKKFNKLPRTSLDLARFQRARESLEKLYILVEGKYQEAVINEQSQPGNVLIIDEAEPPISPSKPNRMLFIIIGFITGTFISIALVLVRDYFDTKVKTPEDIENEKINVLGWIPHIKIHHKKGESELDLLNLNGSSSVISEAFRTLRTRIQFSRTNPDSLKIILVTSSAANEGKTFIAVNLAKSLAQIKRTLIIDCDLRRPRIHRIFETDKSPGLVDFLLNMVPLEKSVHKTEVSNLYYMTCGTRTPNPVEILLSDEMRNLILNLRSRFDYIIIDSPPIIAVSDSEILSRLVDAALLVVGSDSTEIEMMRKAVELMADTKTFFLGAVLNNFAYKKSYGPYYKYYINYTESFNPAASKKLKKQKVSKTN